ncbi:D-2-hydroxyacid dehydrogenase [Aerococcaceae bacterium zg-ZJ1578]|uniref:D-2-hydroxyacid dehydrogenase n=1 Tax=Aerococcaceae bacterium zg-252 TaxID=2796928 RepID=UPI001A1D0A69|nr:D-2-hydroxyacid dehydrogenase [Aerococcaceae bacterium zg-1578]
MKIALFRNLTDKEQQLLQSITDLPYTDFSTQEPSAETIAEYDIVLGWHPILMDVLSLSHNIKWIQLFMVGVDNLPFDLLEKAGVIVTTAKGANATTIAQQTIGCMISFARQLHTSRDNQLQSKWFSPTGLTELTGKSVLTVGTGEIGQALAKLATAFEMTVDGINRSGHDVPGIQNCYPITALDERIGHYDYVINNLPYTPATDKLFGAKQFDLMKQDAIFINMGRGKSVDEQALIHALDTKQINAAALDVFEVEPLPETSPLWQMENVLIMPHRAGISDFYHSRILDIFAKNYREFINGGVPSHNRLDYQKGY